jgi:hypothetical protein
MTVAGAGLALVSGRRGGAALRKTAMAATGVPLCVLLPISGAVLFLVAVAAVSVGSWGFREKRAGLMRQVFPVLSACCFLGLSWQYNAHLLLRAELVAAGIALIVVALAPLGEA